MTLTPPQATSHASQAFSCSPLPTSYLPSSTYRLQLHAGFPFAAAQKILPYLARLGVTGVYLSPIWASSPSSTHGYDVTDHTQVNPELGGLGGLRRFAARAHELGLGLVVDFVPNHMGIAGGHNPYWEDVLQHGQASRYAHFFDIAWQPLKRALEGKVLLPTLGDQYGRVLERGELQIHWTGQRFVLAYWDRNLPLSPRSVAQLLAGALDDFPARAGDLHRAELASITRSLQTLPRSTEASLSDDDCLARAQEVDVASRRLGTLLETSKPVREAVRRTLDAINADPKRLDALVAEQNYRLAYWKVAAEEINYRRFFDINDLAALRMEDPRVFEWAHSLLFELLRGGVVQGVRLDHTDGLYDPAGYFAALQAGAGEALAPQTVSLAAALKREPGELLSSFSGEKPEAQRGLYVVAEKILEPGEQLPPDWAVHGTTGYDFLAQLGGVFVDQANEDELGAIYRRFTGDREAYPAHLYRSKLLIQRVSLPGEVNVLAEHLEQLAETGPHSRDFTLSTLRGALRGVIASFPVYRSYVRPDGQREPNDDARIAQAIHDARAHNRTDGTPLDPSVFEFLHAVLTLNAPDAPTRAAYADFALKFQQLTGPVTAKGAEDTAFYRYARLLSLNEVGSDPAHFGTPVKVFHALARERAKKWPHAMLAGSTHDTKRGEDTRARISVLSELPQGWAAFLSQWNRLFNDLQTRLDDTHAPTLLDVYVLLQNVLGAYPLGGDLTDFPDRMAAYMQKAAREAKLRTSWATPDEGYEAALEQFTRQLLTHPEFMSSLGEVHRRISPYGAQNGLSAALVRLTAPGVPDTYQGCEGWNQSLVDPDNRRPVDYPAHGRVLARLERGHDVALTRKLLDSYEDGAVKTLVTWAALQTRRAHPELFAAGDYQPIEAGKYLLAFARTHAGQTAVTVAPRLALTLTKEKHPWALGESWGNSTLTLPAAGTYTNVLTGETLRVRAAKVPLAKVLEDFPLALLVRE
ncbi:malto-oligosyltrehalose synthase [Deinococcus sp.]|uniref:malto-oligosyltrehalose synthase n=1 Tax=Deinococcus sp. TaxID=47478 RepID=UPI0025B8BC0B|nr:malto-oligosyltrehalose synthase [Deinococcus sp.]